MLLEDGTTATSTELDEACELEDSTELEEMVEKSFEAMVQEAKDRLETLEKKLKEMEANKEEINKRRLEIFMRGFWKPQRPDEGGDKPEDGMPPPPPPEPPKENAADK